MNELPVRIRLARNLRAAREAAGLSQTEAARRLGKSRVTVNNWERETASAPKPSEADLQAAATLYGVDVRVLRYGPADAQAGPRAYQLSREELGWLYRFAGELAEHGASEAEIERVRALLSSDAAREFYGHGLLAMQALAEAVRVEIARRHPASAADVEKVVPAEVFAWQKAPVAPFRATNAEPRPSRKRGGGAR